MAPPKKPDRLSKMVQDLVRGDDSETGVVKGSSGTTTIIIQARLGSSRLPRKTLKAFRGQTVLWHVMKRCDLTGFPVVVAIPNDEPELAIWLEAHNAQYFMGDPKDLARRYLHAAREFQANPIVRITADCPLINTEIIKLTIRLFELQGNVGYLGFHALSGLNVEIFDYDTLEKASNNGPDEHCTTWMRKQPWAKSFPSLELNTQEDYERLLSL